MELKNIGHIPNFFEASLFPSITSCCPKGLSSLASVLVWKKVLTIASFSYWGQVWLWINDAFITTNTVWYFGWRNPLDCRMGMTWLHYLLFVILSLFQCRVLLLGKSCEYALIAWADTPTDSEINKVADTLLKLISNAETCVLQGYGVLRWNEIWKSAKIRLFFELIHTGVFGVHHTGILCVVQCVATY